MILFNEETLPKPIFFFFFFLLADLIDQSKWNTAGDVPSSALQMTSISPFTRQKDISTHRATDVFSSVHRYPHGKRKGLSSPSIYSNTLPFFPSLSLSLLLLHFLLLLLSRLDSTDGQQRYIARQRDRTNVRGFFAKEDRERTSRGDFRLHWIWTKRNRSSEENGDSPRESLNCSRLAHTHSLLSHLDR